MVQQLSKSQQLLAFLQNFGTLRRKRITAYGRGDRVLWLANLPTDLPSAWKDACRSAFALDESDKTEDGSPDFWLRIRKTRKPELPSVPEEVKPWLPKEFLDRPDDYALKNVEELLDLLLQRLSPNTEEGASESSATLFQEWDPDQAVFKEELLLQDGPEVEQAWLEYLVERWEPQASQFRVWHEVQAIYEEVDFMRRRLEEAEERYELVLAVGLLQWRDPVGETVSRHLLTAPAEISQDAVRGILAVSPAAAFDGFRVELDMLEIQHRPDLDPVRQELDGYIEELDIRAWDTAAVGKILRLIANRPTSDDTSRALVDEGVWKPLARVDKTLRMVYAPALILRERRPTGYDELVTRFRELAEDGHLSVTQPWEHFVAEGESSGSSVEGESEGNSSASSLTGRLYFPLSMNDEQQEIAERLRKYPYVLVKGPPGTGKSHTIANLICHLLASRQRVLVTAQAPKALVVLRNLLPGDIPNLCVMALGSTREDQKLLEESVRRIIARKDRWNSETAHQEIEPLEAELLKLEETRAKLDGQLRQCREAETYSHTLFGGYEGTAAQIARQLEREQGIYGWFPTTLDPDSRCPLGASDLDFLAEMHSSLMDERLRKFDLKIGDFSLPDPNELNEHLKALSYCEERWQALSDAVESEQLNRLYGVSEEFLEGCRIFLTDLEGRIVRTSRTYGELFVQAVKDLLLGQDHKWHRLIQNLQPLLNQAKLFSERLGISRIEIPETLDQTKLLADARRRLDHFRKGGKRGFGVFSPRVVRETRYVEEKCWVDGQTPQELERLEVLVTYLELEAVIRQLGTTHPELADLANQADPRIATQRVEELVNEVSFLLELFSERGHTTLNIVPTHEKTRLVDPDEIRKSLVLLDAEKARRSLHRIKDVSEAWLTDIRSLSGPNVHPCMHELAQALVERDVVKWKAAWEIREESKKEKERFRRYEELLDRLEQECRGLKSLLDANRGCPEWHDRIWGLEKAWAWGAATAWLRLVTDKNSYHAIESQRRDIEEKIRSTIESLAELKAWAAFLDQLDEGTKQALVAWQKAMARAGAFKGKYAFKHRRSARRYLRDCIHRIPAWIMPIHRVWETVTAEPGMFDTIIIDEASQAGLDSLILLLLGKRVVVVGDDKQNSPEAVGVPEQDISRLAREHLGDFRFRDEFRPDASLYDHAERAFGNVISLREHFRCVPEIIRFSNELFYSDSSLIPLRQPPPERLCPLKSTYIPGGFCRGERQSIHNPPEADRIVETILECVKDERYKDKTMGVIVLQGRAQAELIERKIAEVLEPRERELRKLRCGVPATFQGDQRDIVFLSLVVAPNHDFRALTTLPDQRRFNVAMSRAKDQVWLFHSVQSHELSRADLRWQLLNFFDNPNREMLGDVYGRREQLEREVRQRVRQLGTQPESYDSWFEVDVALELLRRGYKVIPQYEVSGYRIDLVVEGSERRLAVECDGEAWHGPEQFYQDMHRQRQLERAGLSFVRVRESEFYADRNEALCQIEDRCKELKIHPLVSLKPMLTS